jgi:hypothetical protein
VSAAWRARGGSTVAGNALTREDQIATLELVVETAEEVCG